MLRARPLLSRCFTARRYLSVVPPLRESTIERIRQFEQEKKYQDVEREIDQILQKGTKDDVQESMEVLNRISKHYELDNLPLFMV
jgi:chromosomal replication initiation ATPase DnaA